MKISEFITIDEKNIEKVNIANPELEELEVGIMTEYMQEAVGLGDIVFFNGAIGDDPWGAIDKYFNGKKENTLFVSNVVLPETFNFIVGDLDTLKMSLSAKVYPIKNDFLIYGVTGTNGKTSVVNITSMILGNNNINFLSIGTVGVRKGNSLIVKGSLNSSPPYIDFKRTIFENQDDCIGVFVEVTSHALEQNRFLDIKLDEIFWTNFTQDHLDFHGSEDHYFQAKFKIFEMAKKNVIHVHPSEISLIERLEEEFIKRSKEGSKEDSAYSINYADSNLTRQFKGDPLGGFIEKNFTLALNAISYILKSMGKKRARMVLGNWNQYLPEGRFQIIKDKERTFIIDYAHTPDALEKLLVESREIFPEKERVIIFGCGGNRDRTKRPKMAMAAKTNSEKVIITSDNPRDENPQAIINDIIQSFEESIDFEVDREKAIKKGVEIANANNVVIIAGKGHEDYQEIEGVKHSFKDEEVLRKYL